MTASPAGSRVLVGATGMIRSATNSSLNVITDYLMTLLAAFTMAFSSS